MDCPICMEPIIDPTELSTADCVDCGDIVHAECSQDITTRPDTYSEQGEVETFCDDCVFKREFIDDNDGFGRPEEWEA